MRTIVFFLLLYISGNQLSPLTCQAADRNTSFSPESKLHLPESDSNIESARSQEAESESEADEEPESEPTPETEPGEEYALSEGGNEGQRAALIIIYSMLIILIVCGNIVVIVIISKERELRTQPQNIMLLSLVTARSCIGVFVVPARITGMFSESYLGTVLCKLCHYASVASSVASVFSIVGIAIVKYLLIKCKEKEISNLQSKAWAAVGIIWLMSSLYAIRAPFVFDITIRGRDDERYPLMLTCDLTADYRSQAVYFLLCDIFVLFLVPLVVIILAYGKVIKSIKAEPGEMRAGANRGSGGGGGRRAVGMIITLTLLFIVCSILPLAMGVYIVLGGPYYEGVYILEEAFFMISYSNAWINLGVFWIYREDLKAAFYRRFCNCRV